MKVETAATGWARIYASGPIDIAKHIIRYRRVLGIEPWRDSVKRKLAIWLRPSTGNSCPVMVTRIKKIRVMLIKSSEGKPGRPFRLDPGVIHYLHMTSNHSDRKFGVYEFLHEICAWQMRHPKIFQSIHVRIHCMNISCQAWKLRSALFVNHQPISISCIAIYEWIGCLNKSLTDGDGAFQVLCNYSDSLLSQCIPVSVSGSSLSFEVLVGKPCSTQDSQNCSDYLRPPRPLCFCHAQRPPVNPEKAELGRWIWHKRCDGQRKFFNWNFHGALIVTRRIFA